MGWAAAQPRRRLRIECGDDVARLRQDAQRALHFTLTPRRREPVDEVSVRPVLRERVETLPRRPRGRLHARASRLRFVLESAQVVAHLVRALADPLDLGPEALPLRLRHPLAADEEAPVDAAVPWAQDDVQPLHVPWTGDAFIRFEWKVRPGTHPWRVQEAQLSLLEQLHLGHSFNVRPQNSESTGLSRAEALAR